MTAGCCRKCIDRLARSTFDLFAIVKQIVDAKAQFRSLAEPWADTGTSTGRLMIAVLGGLADVERDLIRTRTAEGRSRAQKRGQDMGRPPKLTPAQQAEARRRRAEGATLAELARSYHVGKSTISRLTALECLTAKRTRGQGCRIRGLGRNSYVQLRHLRPYQPRSLYHQPTGNDCPRVPDAVKQEARFALDSPLERSGFEP